METNHLGKSIEKASWIFGVAIIVCTVIVCLTIFQVNRYGIVTKGAAIVDKYSGTIIPLK